MNFLDNLSIYLLKLNISTQNDIELHLKNLMKWVNCLEAG